MKGGHRGADVSEELWPERYLLILKLTVVIGHTAIVFLSVAMVHPRCV